MKACVIGCTLVLAVAGCTRAPETLESGVATYQWFVEPGHLGEWNPHNLLVTSDLREDPGVIAALESALRYGLAGAPNDSVCYLTYGTDERGEWVDPSEGLVAGLADVPVALAPVSVAGLNPVPRAKGCQFSAVEQPNMPRLLCTVKLRKWEPGEAATIYVNVSVSEHRSVRGAGSTAYVRCVDGDWVVDEWSGKTAWSPN